MNNQNLTDAINAINQSADRANKVTDFFEAVTTGDKSQSVSSPVDGKLIPTVAKQVNDAFNDNSGQLNSLVSQATSQADRAKSEADRASQISGLDTVADAIGLAAAPFPDVWIPFNDSLRMLAGYGREVKVGDDVVARMVNSERSTTATYTDKAGVLRTAAINEPRFENQGLLREVQSTNLILRSHTHTSVNLFTDTGETTEAPLNGSAAVRVLSVNEAGTSNNFIRFNNPVTGSISTARTSSCWVKPFGVDATISIECEDAGVVRVLCKSNAWTRISATRTNPLTAKPIGFFDISIFSPTQGQRLAVWGAQLEDLPYASSYIPTNGAAVTRAADKVTIHRPNNDCVEWYSGADKIAPIVTADTIQLAPPAGKYHLRNVKGFFTPLTDAQKKALK
ncbi:MAG: phage head spike fiber domain-containing protein [Plesiomonas sp.]